jgi:hypothetical protein
MANTERQEVVASPKNPTISELSLYNKADATSNPVEEVENVTIPQDVEIVKSSLKGPGNSQHFEMTYGDAQNHDLKPRVCLLKLIYPCDSQTYGLFIVEFQPADVCNCNVLLIHWIPNSNFLIW